VFTIEKVLGKSFQGFSEEESVFLELSFTTLKVPVWQMTAPISLRPSLESRLQM
jgi:hypothetical protein